jgi:hypothetical protein
MMEFSVQTPGGARIGSDGEIGIDQRAFVLAFGKPGVAAFNVWDAVTDCFPPVFDGVWSADFKSAALRLKSAFQDGWGLTDY